MLTMTPEILDELTMLASHHALVRHYVLMWSRGECTQTYALTQTVLALAEQNDTLFRELVAAKRGQPQVVALK